MPETSRWMRRISWVLIAALIATCPGLGAYQAAAAEIESVRAGAPLTPAPLVQNGLPALGSVPGALSDLPSAPAAVPGLAPAGAEAPRAPDAAANAPQAPAQAPKKAPEAALPGLRQTVKAEGDLGRQDASASDEQEALESDFAADAAFAPASAVVAAPRGSAVLGRLSSRAKGAARTAHEYLFGEDAVNKLAQKRQGDVRKTRNLLIADGGLSIILSLLIGPLIDTARAAAIGGVAGHVGVLVALTAGILATFAVYVGVEYKHSLLKETTGLFFVRDLREAVARHLLKQDLDFHQEKDHASTALGKRVLGDTNYLETKNMHGPLSLWGSAAYAVFGVGMMFYVNAPLAAAITVGSIALGVLIGLSADKLTQLSHQQTDDQAELVRRGQESLSQTQTVKSFGNEAAETARYGVQAEGLLKTSLEITRLRSRLNLLAGTVTTFLTSYLVYIVGGWLAIQHALTFGQVVQMSIFASFASTGFMLAAYAILLIMSNKGSSEVVRGLLERQPTIVDAAGAPALAGLDGDIAFENVSFTYPQRKEGGKVLTDVSFHAKPGETVAFVGETGSGKSTITSLLLELWRPQEGRVLVDGQDLSQVQRQSFLDRVAVVPQDTRLFSSTIRYNMTYGSKDVTDEQLTAAVRMAKAEFVYNKQLFPEGLDTKVSEGGERLSGGERQRIAIVRALLRHPSVLILDEATSALDNASEKVVQSALDRLSSGQAGRKPTTIVIAHRLTTIKNADRIYVLDKGRIVESGSHAELLARDGRYAALWRKGGYDQDAGAQAAPAEAPDAASAQAAPEPSVAADPAAQSPAPKVPFSHKIKRGWFSVRNWILGDGVLAPIMKKYRWAMAGTAALMTLDSGLWLYSASLLKHLLDAAEAAAKAGGVAAFGASLTHMSLAIVGVLAVLTALDWAGSWLSGMLNAKVLRDIRERLMGALLRREMAFHLRHDSGELASRLSEDSDSLARKTVDDRLPLLKNALTFVASSLMLIHANLFFGLLILVVSIGVGKISGYVGQKAESTYEVFSKKRAEFGRNAQESFEHIRTVKTFGQEDSEAQRSAERAEALAQAGVPGRRYMAQSHAWSSSLTDLFTKYAPYIGGAWLAAYAMGVGLGTIIAMTLLAGFVKSSVDGLSSGWMDYKQSHGETSIIRRWLAQSPQVADAPGAKPLKISRGEVRFENVDFRYSKAGQGGGLSGLSLDVEPGQTVAFVGETGSGKSTTLRLLQRLWDPQSGRILIDGQDVAKVTLESLNRQIAVVPQETRLFDDTLRYNMLYGNETASEAELMAAIKAARADFVFDKNAFPDGLATRVGEGGSSLSGGQAQRVAIVRAILKKSRILLLDEATAKLDKQTEKEIQETLDQVIDGPGSTKPTTLVVAHNLTTIRNADRIVVLGQGRILEQGTHEELLARRGAYYRLWTAAQQSR